MLLVRPAASAAEIQSLKGGGTVSWKYFWIEKQLFEACNTCGAQTDLWNHFEAKKVKRIVPKAIDGAEDTLSIQSLCYGFG